LVSFSTARSRGTKKTKAKKAMCAFGKDNPYVRLAVSHKR
jgi:hypothetical protein